MTIQAQKFQTKHNNHTPQKLGNSQLPFSADAETYVIGAMIMSPVCINQVLDIINVEDFYIQKNKTIFQSILNLHESKTPIDLLTIREDLKRNGALLEAGGDLYILEVNRKTYSSANVQTHCMIMLEKAMKRRIIQISYEVYKKATDDTENIVEVVPFAIDKFKENIFLNTRDNPDNDATEYSKYLNEIREGKIKHIKTGLQDLDKLIDGFLPGDFVVIAARPGAGKSAIAVTFALYQCFYRKNPVHFVSIEMSRNQLMNRIISQQTKIPLRDLKKGNFNELEHDKIIQRLIDHATNNFFIDSNVSDIDIIVQNIRIRSIKNKTKIVYIDNFQNIRTNRRFNSEKEQNSYFSNVLRDLAKELQIVIISLNQLNRAAATRGKKQPILSDLRDTGDLEQDAQIVILLDRPDAEKRETFDDDTDSKGLADIIVAKNRDGNMGIVRSLYIGEIARFQTYNQLADRETW